MTSLASKLFMLVLRAQRRKRRYQSVRAVHERIRVERATVDPSPPANLDRLCRVERSTALESPVYTLSPRAPVRDGATHVFYLHGGVYLSQRDVRELQFAKASIATGWTILCREFGIEPSEIQQVLLAGSFGSYLSAASAVRIGLVPKLALPRIISAGRRVRGPRPSKRFSGSRSRRLVVARDDWR